MPKLQQYLFDNSNIVVIKMLVAINEMKYILLIAIFIYSYLELSATPQVPDLLIYNGDTISLFSNPLESYLTAKGIGDDDRGCNSSACWRGYVATWQIKNDSLFLVNIKRCSNYIVAGIITGLECEDADTSKVMKFLIKEFKDQISFASWYSGELISLPLGVVFTTPNYH